MKVGIHVSCALHKGTLLFGALKLVCFLAHDKRNDFIFIYFLENFPFLQL